MKRHIWFIAVAVWMGPLVPLSEALVIEQPIEGQTIVIGEPFKVVVRPGPGDNCKWVGSPDIQLNPSTGRFEFEDTFKPDDNMLGQENYAVLGQTDDKDFRCRPGKAVKVNVVLPSTTTVKEIGAAFAGQKKAYPSIARKPNGELVTLGGYSDRELSVGATYSDGVRRKIVSNPDVTYKSLDEKVAVVFPAGQWKKTDGRVGENYALVRATGPGKTDIIVRYGEFTDRVTVVVDECPYIEGKMDIGCPR